MKFTLSWLKEHLDTNASIDEIVDYSRDAVDPAEPIVERGLLLQWLTVRHRAVLPGP